MKQSEKLNETVIARMSTRTVEKVDEEARRTGVNRSEVIRRAVDAYALTTTPSPTEEPG